MGNKKNIKNKKDGYFNYKKKYLKYKKKYLDLKKLDGGTKMEHIPNITGNLLLSNHQPLAYVRQNALGLDRLWVHCY